MRTCAAYFAQQIPEQNRTTDDVLLATSTLNLAEFLCLWSFDRSTLWHPWPALRPDFLPCRKLYYFHENQLNYPVREEKERDFQLGWIQVVRELHSQSTSCARIR